MFVAFYQGLAALARCHDTLSRNLAGFRWCAVRLRADGAKAFANRIEASIARA
jgi:hypothetical protein